MGENIERICNWILFEPRRVGCSQLVIRESLLEEVISAKKGETVLSQDKGALRP